MATPTSINPHIFGAYDVRGIAGENLTEEVAYQIGRAAALYLNVPAIAVGRDMRGLCVIIACDHRSRIGGKRRA